MSLPSITNNSINNVISQRMATQIPVFSNNPTILGSIRRSTTKMAIITLAIVNRAHAMEAAITSKTLMISTTTTNENLSLMVVARTCHHTNNPYTNHSFKASITHIYSSLVCSLREIFRTTILTTMKMNRATLEATSIIRIIPMNTTSKTTEATIPSRCRPRIRPICRAWLKSLTMQSLTKWKWIVKFLTSCCKLTSNISKECTLQMIKKSSSLQFTQLSGPKHGV